jgi:hypothetical protein
VKEIDMLRRRVLGLALLIPFLSPFPVRAGDKPAKTPPTVVVRVKSLQTVIDHAKLLTALAGREGIANQIEGLIKAKVGAKGLSGVDPDRPFGFYGSIGKELNDVVGVLVVPIADEKEFLSTLENFNYPAKKGKDDLYTISVGNIASPLPDVQLRFSNKYAYFSALNPDALKKTNLADPGSLFPAQQTASVSATLRLDQIPPTAKDILRAQVEQELEKAKEKGPKGESAAQREFRLKALDELAKRVDMILEQGAESSVELDVNKEKNEFSASFRLSGKAGTELAKAIQKAGQDKSLFGSFPKEGTAARGHLHFLLKEDMAKAFEKAILDNMEKGVNKISDEDKRKQAQAVIDGLKPTLRAGEIDSAVSFYGPGPKKHFGLVVAIKLREGDKLAKTVRELAEQTLKEIPPAEAAKIKLDAETVAGVKIHRIDAQENYDAKAKEVFGDNPLYVAFRSDAVFIAVGEDALTPLKKAVADQQAEVAPVFLFEVSLVRLAPLMAKKEAEAKALQELLKSEEDGTIRFTVTGGAALQAQLTTRLSVVRLIGQIAATEGRKLPLK